MHSGIDESPLLQMDPSTGSNATQDGFVQDLGNNRVKVGNTIYDTSNLNQISSAQNQQWMAGVMGRRRQ